MQTYRFVEGKVKNNVGTVRFRQQRLSEPEIVDACNEIAKFAQDQNCPRIVLDFAASAPDCLYSVFLAKLVSLQRQLQQMKGGLRLCNCNENVRSIFQACCLDHIFEIHADLPIPEEGWEN